jgi:hypothetical protein
MTTMHETEPGCNEETKAVVAIARPLRQEVDGGWISTRTSRSASTQ